MKKFVVLITSLFLTLGLFAQNAPSTGLTDKDVKNFIKNYPAFVKEVDRLDANQSDLSVLATYGEIELILEKVGLSGPNRADKLAMIGYSLAVCAIEQEMDAETLAMMKAFGMADPAASIRPYVNEKDYKIVKNNYAALAKVLDIESDFNEKDEPEPEEEMDYGALLGALTGGFGMSSKKEAKVNPKNKQASKTEYNKNVEFAKSVKGKLTSSKKDSGFLYKEYDKKRASQYKLVKTITEPSYSKFSDGYRIDINYNTEDYSGSVWFEADFDLRFGYWFSEFGDPDSGTAISDSNSIASTKVEIYAVDKDNTDLEAEVVVYTKSAGVIHIWYEESGNAVLSCGGLGTLKGTHNPPTP